MNNKDIHLEPIPGINLGNEEEKKEAESKINQNEQIPQEVNKIQPDTGSSQGKKDSNPSIDPRIKKKIIDFRKKMLKEKKYKYRLSSLNLTPTLDFLSSFALLEENDDKEMILEENKFGRSENDSLSNKKKNLEYDESIGSSDNTKKLFGYNSKAEKNPVRDGLLNRIDQLRRNQRDIDMQFKYDSEIYKKKINALEKACEAGIDEAKLKKLEKTNKENKEIIREYKRSIEQAEKEKTKDNKNFSEALNGILELKAILMSELKELEILAKKVTFQDYDEYYKDNPTKIEKINFRPNDSRYLLTNEYETSREEEESFSSYEKLNRINNTPEGFDINKRKNSLSKTEQYFYNTKNFVGTAGSINNNVINNSFINNNRINNSYIVGNNKNNQETEKYSFRKNGTLNDMKNRKSLNDINIRSSKVKSNKNVSNFNISSKNNDNYFRNKKSSNNIPQDPDFLDKEKIIIPDIRKGDSFY